MSSQQRAGATKVVVASTVMLAFISFWRAAAIVLNDLGSTVYYVGGIGEQAIGRSAPWFILCVMLFSFAVRSIYMESSSMFVRGGVYVVVRDAMGPFMARLSVSALLFDFTPFSRLHGGCLLVLKIGVYHVERPGGAHRVRFQRTNHRSATPAANAAASHAARHRVNTSATVVAKRAPQMTMRIPARRTVHTWLTSSGPPRTIACAA